MGSVEDMRNLAQGLVDSYEMRVKTVSALMKETAELLKKFRVEQEEMVTELRNTLAKAESLRKKDFDSMMKGIQTQQMEREERVAHMVEKFQREQEEMVAELRRIVTESGCVKPERLANLKAAISVQERKREREVAQVLRDFHREQEELNTALRGLLSKGESVRIKDFKAVVKALEIQRKGRDSEVGKILEEFGRVCEEVSAKWRKVMVT
jgi:Fe2+ transport system protein B